MGWLMLPREHGAWGLVSLPFLAAAAIAQGDLWKWETLAAAFGVLSMFLLRDPLSILLRNRREPSRSEVTGQTRIATRTLLVCLPTLAVAGIVLLLRLPAALVVTLGAGGLTLVLMSVKIAVERIQREITAQVLSVAGLTGSCLAAYLAVHGSLDPVAFAIWALSAAHAIGSVLVVRARLETILNQRKPAELRTPRRFFRSAVWWHAALWSALTVAALAGSPWLLLPFTIPSALHIRELWQFRHGAGLGLSMHRVGWTQLGASLLFYALMILLFRTHSLGA